jgi:hypothetical protein
MKTLVINEQMRVNLIESDGVEKGSLSIIVSENSVHGDVRIGANLNKKDLKKLLEFLRRADQVI